MRIHVELDRAAALNDISRDAEFGMPIYFEHDGVQYPGDTWNDFGVRLLGFWLRQLHQLRDGGRGDGEFVFLDGDFSLACRVDSAGLVELSPKNADEPFVWRLPAREIETAVLDAARALLGQLDSFGFRPRALATPASATACFSKALYKQCNRIERFFNRVKTSEGRHAP